MSSSRSTPACRASSSEVWRGRRGTCRPRRRPRPGCRWRAPSPRLTWSLRDDVVEQLGDGVAGRARPARAGSTGAVRWDRPDDEDAHGTTRASSRDRRRRPSAGRPCAARGTRGSAARWTGRPCAPRRSSGTASTAGAKFRMLLTPAATSRSQTSCATAAGVAITPMATPCRATSASRSVERRDRRARRPSVPTIAGVGVDQRPDREPAGGEAAVVGQRVAEVADADDDDRPVLGQAELAGDLVDEVLDVVADAAGAVGAQVGEVLAQLGRVDPGGGGELLGGDRGDALVGQRAERPQVDGQPGHRGVRDAAGGGTRPRGAAGSALGRSARSSQGWSRDSHWPVTGCHRGAGQVRRL